MVSIKQISFKNFRSYGKNITVFNFDEPGTTMIAARNLAGGTTNGLGKTSILHCLTWLLYDQVIDNINKDELINNINKADLWGEVIFDVDELQYCVRRWRKSGKNNRENGVQLLINEIDCTLSSVDLTNKKIEECIGVDFELFTRIVVYSATNKSFFEMPAASVSSASQSGMIEQLFNLQILTEKAKQLKKHIKDADDEIGIQHRLIAQVESQLTKHSVLIDHARNRSRDWAVTNSTRLLELRSNSAKIASIDFPSECAAHETLHELMANQTSILTEAKLSILAQDRLSSRVATLVSEVEQLKHNKCPFCAQTFAGADEKIIHHNIEIEKLNLQLVELTEVSAMLTSELEQLLVVIKDTKRLITVTDYQQLLNLRSQHTTIAATIAEIQTQTNPHVNSIKELETNTPTPPDYSTINTLTSLNEHQQFLLKLLTKKDSFIRKALLQRNIPLLNDRLATHLTDLGLQHRVEFNLNLTAVISQFGRELSYGCLSAGQRARVNLALFFAFGDILELLHHRVNIRVLDEALDIGLCNQGIKEASTLLRRRATTAGLSIYIISHREEIRHEFSNVKLVEFVDGFSQIVQEN